MPGVSVCSPGRYDAIRSSDSRMVLVSSTRLLPIVEDAKDCGDGGLASHASSGRWHLEIPGFSTTVDSVRGGLRHGRHHSPVDAEKVHHSPQSHRQGPAKH